MINRLTRAICIAALLTISLAAPAVAEAINGTSGPDVLVGTAKADTIRGFGGADKTYGRAGPDHIYGGYDAKRDFLYGGRGKDLIIARLADRVYAGSGNDIIRVLPPPRSSNPTHLTEIDCGPGYDQLYGITAGWIVFKTGCEKVG